MKVTNGEISSAKDALQRLMDQKWPVKVSYWLARLLKKINSEFDIINGERNKLVIKYAPVPEEGKQTIIKPGDENWEKFVDEFNTLMEMETDIEFNVVKIPEMVDGRAIEIEPSILLPLTNFVEIEEEVKEH